MSMKKIAQLAEVSISTVSLVLAGKGRISETVKARVLRAAKELNYKSPLYSDKNNIVAVLYTIDREWKHVLAFINGILVDLEASLVSSGVTPVLLPISFNESVESIRNKISDISPQAVCSIHYINEALFESLEKNCVPVVVINRSTLQGKFCTVCVDDFQGAYEGGQILLNRKLRGRALFFGYEKGSMTNLIDDRAYGFQKALLEDGRDNVQKAIYYIKEPLIEGVDEVLRSFDNSEFPSAIFAYDDYLALFVIAGLEKFGLSVPDNVLLIAPGDTLDYDQPFTPQISTMSIDTGLLGVLGANMIVESLKGNAAEMLVHKVRQKFISRGSC